MTINSIPSPAPPLPPPGNPTRAQGAANGAVAALSVVPTIAIAAAQVETMNANADAATDNAKWTGALAIKVPV